MRNPSKLLEKSKSLELNPRKSWSSDPRIKKCSTKFYAGEDVVSFEKKIIRFGITIFFGLWPDFLGLLGIDQITFDLSGLQFWLS
jgi:hypothetical protein